VLGQGQRLGQGFSGRRGSWLGCKQGGLLGVQATTWVWGQQFQPLHAPGHPTSVCHEGVNGLNREQSLLVKKWHH